MGEISGLCFSADQNRYDSSLLFSATLPSDALLPSRFAIGFNDLCLMWSTSAGFKLSWKRIPALQIGVSRRKCMFPPLRNEAWLYTLICTRKVVNIKVTSINKRTYLVMIKLEVSLPFSYSWTCRCRYPQNRTRMIEHCGRRMDGSVSFTFAGSKMAHLTSSKAPLRNSLSVSTGLEPSTEKTLVVGTFRPPLMSDAMEPKSVDNAFSCRFMLRIFMQNATSIVTHIRASAEAITISMICRISLFVSRNSALVTGTSWRSNFFSERALFRFATKTRSLERLKKWDFLKLKGH